MPFWFYGEGSPQWVESYDPHGNEGLVLDVKVERRTHVIELNIGGHPAKVQSPNQRAALLEMRRHGWLFAGEVFQVLGWSVGKGYAVLYVLEERGLVESRWFDRMTPPRRQYRITDEGRRVILS